jgi:hypothetical protein
MGFNRLQQIRISRLALAVVTAVAATAFALGTEAARAEDVALSDGLSRLAAQVVKVITQEGGELAVDVGDFVGTPRLKAAGGPGIALLVGEALEAKGVTVREPAPYQLLGTFKTVDGRAAEDDRFNSVALRIEATVLDAKDQELGKLNINVFGDAPLQFAGGTGSLPPVKEGQPSAVREDAKRAAFESPHAAVVGTETRDAPPSPFGIEVLVGKQPRAPSLQGGRSFVRLEKGEEYVVRLHNRAPFEAAVTLTIDGLSMFAFSEDGSFGSQVLIPAGRFVEIPGWYVNNIKTDAFEIGGYADSAAASKLLPSTSVGVITATFHESIQGSGKDPKATKRGRQIDQAYVEEKRLVKPATAVVSVRYDR